MAEREIATTEPELRELIERYTKEEVARWKTDGLRARIQMDTRARLSHTVYNAMNTDEIKSIVARCVTRHVEKWSMGDYQPTDHQIREANSAYKSSIDAALRQYAYEAGEKKAKEIIDVLSGEAFKTTAK